MRAACDCIAEGARERSALRRGCGLEVWGTPRMAPSMSMSMSMSCTARSKCYQSSLSKGFSIEVAP
eukprot:scaffold9814_cov54-Phaeocystis_antarctica.AAC.2